MSRWLICLPHSHQQSQVGSEAFGGGAAMETKVTFFCKMRGQAACLAEDGTWHSCCTCCWSCVLTWLRHFLVMTLDKILFSPSSFFYTCEMGPVLSMYLIGLMWVWHCLGQRVSPHFSLKTRALWVCSVSIWALKNPESDTNYWPRCWGLLSHLGIGDTAEDSRLWTLIEEGCRGEDVH